MRRETDAFRDAEVRAPAMGSTKPTKRRERKDPRTLGNSRSGVRRPLPQLLPFVSFRVVRGHSIHELDTIPAADAAQAVDHLVHFNSSFDETPAHASMTAVVNFR